MGGSIKETKDTPQDKETKENKVLKFNESISNQLCINNKINIAIITIYYNNYIYTFLFPYQVNNNYNSN